MTCQSVGLGLRRLQMRKGAPCIRFAHCKVDRIRTVRKPFMKPDDCLKINRTIYFHICRFSKLPIFNLGASCFCSEWLARANLRNGPSPNLSPKGLHSRQTPLTPGSTKFRFKLLLLQVYQLQCTAEWLI